MSVIPSPEEYHALFGFYPTSIGLRPRSYWTLDETNIDDDDRAAGAFPGCLCVKTRDGESNDMDLEALRLPNFVGTTQDAFDGTYRYYYYRPLDKVSS